MIRLLAMSILLLLIPVGTAAEWAGADDLAQKKVEEITGGEYKPWLEPVWKPPSGEIETFLSALQAAIGAVIIGYFIGYYKGKGG